MYKNSLRSLEKDIHTPRVFIPSATGYTRNRCTFGIKVMGYSKSYYNDLKYVGNLKDDIPNIDIFYDLLRAAYGLEFSYPTLNPYVQYVDYMKSIGGGFSADNTDVIKHLREHCNTLIIPDQAEYQDLYTCYNQLYAENDACSRFPARFAKFQRQY